MKSMHVAVLVAALSTASFCGAQAQKSSTYKSGFSSQRSTSATKPAPAPRYSAPSSSRSSSGSSFGSFSRDRQSATQAAPAPSRSTSGSFGSFGSRPSSSGTAAATTPLPQRSNSAMTRSLEQNASQAKAMQTYESRRAAQSIPRAPVIAPTPYQGTPSTNSSAYDSDRYRSTASEQRPPQSYDRPNAAPRSYQPPRYENSRQPAPTYTNRNDNGMSNVLTGVLIGQGASTPRAAPAPTISQPSVVMPQAGAPIATAAPAVKASSSSSGGWLKAFIWMALSGLAFYGTYYWVSKRMAAAAAQKPNYSLEN